MVSNIYTTNATEWPYVCGRSIKKLLTHSIVLASNYCGYSHLMTSIPRRPW